MTSADYLAYQQRRQPAHRLPPQPVEDAPEARLHHQILDWCDGNWPKWKTIHQPMHRRSQLAEGVADFVIFGPHPLVLVIEAKRANEKPTPKQRDWAAEMRMLGWEVQVVRSFEQFLQLARPLGEKHKP